MSTQLSPGREHPHDERDGATAAPAAETQQARGAQYAHRPHQRTAAVTRRLARAEGHLAAVRRMVEEGRDCPEVLIQLAAVRAALDATARVILADHMETCVRDAARNGDADQAWADLERALQSFIR
ncbi:MAG: metal-sensing transcriptional repressor [Chloroflexi bacterium]|nr:metal-sensing transcriptional repressor [Chloroflexota bacterium]